MYTPQSNNLLSALLSLVSTIPELPRKKGFVPGQKSSGRKKTKKGATHVIGTHFKPKSLITIDGKTVTPAMYRRLHLGVQNPRKKMDISLLTKTAQQVGRTLTKHSPTILTALGITGFVSTVIMAVKATPKAIDILDHERSFRHDEYGSDYDEPISVPDTVELTWKVYVPTALMGATSIACIIGASSITNRRNLALTSLYSIAESTLKDYQKKVVETIGEGKEKKIRTEIAGDQLTTHPMDSKSIIVSGLGDTLCFDQYTGRYFKGDVEQIRKAVNDFNRQLLSDMRIPLNDLYSELGLAPVESGQYVGWDVEKGLVDIDFSAKLASGNVPCVVLTFTNKPTKLW